MKKSLALTLLLLLSLPLVALAQTWTGTLQGGGVVTVDPNTNKATLYTDKGSTQMWDGAHRLQDGSVIIIDNGIVTSGAGSHQTPITPPVASEPGVSAPASSVCVELVIKVCGFNGECSDKPACSPARQLMQLERDEAWQSRSQGPNKTSGQCREALQNEDYFARCEQNELLDTPTACKRLVDSVCGDQEQCDTAPACSPARQLLAMETQERLAARDPERPTYSSKRCLEALGGSDFFKRCLAPEQSPAVDSGSETPGSGMPLYPPQRPTPAHR